MVSMLGFKSRPGQKTEGIVGPDSITGGVMGPCLKSGGVVDPKNSTDRGT